MFYLVQEGTNVRVVNHDKTPVIVDGLEHAKEACGSYHRVMGSRLVSKRIVPIAVEEYIRRYEMEVDRLRERVEAETRRGSSSS